jgi:DNA adenine methylase
MGLQLTAESARSAIALADKSLESLAFATIIKNRGITSHWHPETLKRRILEIAQVKDRIDFIEALNLKARVVLVW